MRTVGLILCAFGPSCGEGPRESATVGVARAAISESPAWSVQSDQINASFGRAVSGAGDVNGDGFDDVLVGAPAFDAPGENSGAAFLYLGSAAGVEAAAAWQARAPSSGDQLGNAVSDAGDVDDDGFGDVIIGLPWAGPAYEGAVHVYLGSAAGLADAPDWVVQGTESMRMGDAVSGAGDVNGDGFDDVIVGAFSDLDAAGSAHVFLGGPGGLDSTAVWSFSGSAPQTYVGGAVAGAGDVNGDGYDDVLVGATGTSNGEYHEGAAYLFLGSPDGPEAVPAWSVESDQVQAAMGNWVSSAGDVDADGYDDALVAAVSYDEGEDGEGKVLLFRGSADGLAAAPSWSAQGDQAGAAFGDSVRGAGDVNADGFDDFLVGAVTFDLAFQDEGAAFLYVGSADGPESTPTWTGGSGQAGGWFGGSVSGAGDVNGDGFRDLLVGAEYADEGGQNNEGMAFVFLGDCTDGTPCPGGVCRDGACDTGESCHVDGAWWDDGAQNPGNECELCDVATSRTAWTPLADGASCLGGVCEDGHCASPDAGAPPDAAPDAGAPESGHSSGCACRMGADHRAPNLASLLAVAGLVRAARRRRARSVLRLGGWHRRRRGRPVHLARKDSSLGFCVIRCAGPPRPDGIDQDCDGILFSAAERRTDLGYSLRVGRRVRVDARLL